MSEAITLLVLSRKLIGRSVKPEAHGDAPITPKSEWKIQRQI
jgi:hypothetical protein